MPRWDVPHGPLPTIASDKGHGCPGVIVYCAALYCSNSGRISWERLDLPDETAILHIPRHRSFRCKKCTARNLVEIRADWPDHQARLRREALATVPPTPFKTD